MGPGVLVEGPGFGVKILGLGSVALPESPGSYFCVMPFKKAHLKSTD